MKKSIFPLFETICVHNNRALHPQYHIARFKNAYAEHFEQAPPFGLLDGLELAHLDPRQKYKLRVAYNANRTQLDLAPYARPLPQTLKIVQHNTLDYHLKWTDRSALRSLFEQRGNADDVLIVKNGQVTDSTYANILFWDGHGRVTPAQPLLKGTCRSRLLAQGQIAEADIRVQDLSRFTSFQLVNALNDFNEDRWLPMANILGQESPDLP